MAYEPGTQIRVRFTARITGSEEGAESNTTEVTETSGVEWTHFLFLGSPGVTRNGDGTVTADFTATVRKSDGASGTQRVRENNRYTHFLFLESESITSPAEEVTGVGEAMTVITNTEAYLGAGQVRARIRELEDALDKWAVMRLRNTTVIARFPTQELAARYIDEEDYRPDRVAAVFDSASADIPDELVALRELQRDASSRIPGWDAADGLTAIVRSTVIDELYAKDLFARDAIGGADILDDWPYCFIDWEQARDEIKERRAFVQFGGVFYYQAVD